MERETGGDDDDDDNDDDVCCAYFLWSHIEVTHLRGHRGCLHPKAATSCGWHTYSNTSITSHLHPLKFSYIMCLFVHMFSYIYQSGQLNNNQNPANDIIPLKPGQILLVCLHLVISVTEYDSFLAPWSHFGDDWRTASTAEVTRCFLGLRSWVSGCREWTQIQAYGDGKGGKRLTAGSGAGHGWPGEVQSVRTSDGQV